MKVRNGGRKTKKGVKAARNIKRLKQTYDKLKFHGVKELLRTMKDIKKYLIQKKSRRCKELKAIDPTTESSSDELKKCLEQIQAIKTVPQDILVNIATSLLSGDKPHPDANSGIVPLITSHKRFIAEVAAWKDKYRSHRVFYITRLRLSEVKRPNKSVSSEDTPALPEAAAALPKSKNMLLSLDDPANAPVKKKRPPKNRRVDTTMNKYKAPDDREYHKPTHTMHHQRAAPQEVVSTAKLEPKIAPTRVQPERHAPRQHFAPNTDKHTKHMTNNAPKKDELHPSWVAKQQQKIVISSISTAPAGKKIVFD